MKKLGTFLTNNWRTVTLALALGGVTILLFSWKLASLPGGTSNQEVAYVSTVDSGHDLFQTPAYLLHKIPNYALVRLGADSIVFFRMISVIIGAVAVFSMFYILSRWYSKRISILGSVLFATSSIVLHAVRYADPSASYLLLLPVIASGLYVQSSKRHRLALVILLITLCLMVYIPGFIWLSIAVLIWQGRRLIRVIRRTPLWLTAVCGVIVVALLTPAGIALAAHPKEIFTMFGLPTHIDSIPVYVTRLKTTLLALGWRYSPTNSANWVAGTPIIDVFTFAMIALGAYSLRFERRLVRCRMQLGLMGLFGLLILTGGPVGFYALIAILYLLAAGGIAFMLQEWFAVFPRNPVARTLAVVLIVASVGTCSYYHLYRYFRAWPSSSQTKTAFREPYLIK